MSNWIKFAFLMPRQASLRPNLRPTMTQPDIYTVFCIFQGQSDIFAVDIEKTKTVDHLRAAIIATQKLKDFTTTDIVLHPVEIKNCPNIVEKVDEEMQKKHGWLDATNQVFEIFQGMPKRGSVHIIVELKKHGG